MIAFFCAIGHGALHFIQQTGKLFVLLLESLSNIIKPPLRIKQTTEQMYLIGVNATFVVALTSLFIGMVYALQIYYGFHKFGAENMMGYTVAVTLGREISPVFAALMITARSTSAMAAEIGTMKVTEQIDALKSMAVDPIHYLATPRIIATTIMTPVLVILSNIVGNIGGYFVSVNVLGVNSVDYLKNIQIYLDMQDLTYGFIKGAVFGLLISTIGCFMGFETTGGAKGVGRFTTKAVVVACVVILIADYFLTAIMF
ncbi:MAG: ABC transporter permease [Desulfurellaceae bacterium]|jgi:phospholipid/cholesterol/gamma-HCH transport system permease protein|nr:ABC transporter permease [Desulfurellaceae bacterium]